MVNFVSWGQKCATCQTKGARREMAETREGREHRQLELSRSSQLGVSEAVSRGPCEQRGDRGPYNVRACKVRACEVKHESGCVLRGDTRGRGVLHFGWAGVRLARFGRPVGTWVVRQVH